tara:strand:+ start:124438 stop:124740 length:303 start_codon:yes stop_codon:yes gene_type:complete
MHCLTVLYTTPDDPDAFRSYYVDQHLPLARTLPGLIKATYAFPEPLGPGDTPFCIFQAYFEDAAAMGAALQSEIGAKVAADVPNYAPKGAVLCNFPVIEA